MLLLARLFAEWMLEYMRDLVDEWNTMRHAMALLERKAPACAELEYARESAAKAQAELVRFRRLPLSAKVAEFTRRLEQGGL